MNATQLIDTYERILGITRAMLDAARRNDWERVTELEPGCRSEVANLVAIGDDGPRLSAPMRERKLAIVRRVLADDAEIRRIAEPRMAELEQLIGHVSNEQRLLQSYGAGA